MAKRIAAMCLLVLAAWSAAFVVADEPTLFDRLDANKDGAITGNEVDADKKRLFDQLLRNADSNDDGRLSREEFTAGTTNRPRQNESQPREQPARPNPRELMTRFDKNGDGKIDKDEAPGRLGENFERIDANSDGSLDREELQRAMSRFNQRPQPANQPNPPRRPGQPSNRQPREGQPPQGLTIAMELLRVLDRNRDGELSSDEIANASKALSRLDRNDDGRLSPRELTPPSRPQQGDNPGGEQSNRRLNANFNPLQHAQRLMQADKDGDNKISKEEASATDSRMLKSGFDRLDINSDGFVQRAELIRALSRSRQQDGQGRPRRPQQPDRESDRSETN